MTKIYIDESLPITDVYKYSLQNGNHLVLRKNKQ